MRQKNKIFNIVRPQEIIRESRKSLKNIFQSPLKEYQKSPDDPDHYIAGEKEVRKYKNKMKRKKKLTSAHPERINLKKGQSNDLLTRQEVIDCLPKGVRLIKNLENSLKQIRTMRENHRKELSATKLKGNESHLMKTIDEYRELMEERQKTGRLNDFPNLMSLHWISTLRENRRTEKSGQTILVKNKMIVCGTSKRKNEDKWAREKENEGYGFRLLPDSYLMIRDSQLTE